MTIEVQPVVAFDDAVEIQMTNSVISRTGISASQRRRSILLLLAVVGHCAIRRAARRCVIYNSLRLTFSFEAHSALLSDRRFKRMYRLSRHDFCGITDLVVANRIACGSPKVRVPVESRLSMTLRYLACGSYLDIAISHCVSISTFYFVVDEMLVDLDESLSIKFPFRSAEWLERSSIGFSRDRSPLRGCVGALDGIAIKIYEPSAADAANPSTYYNRKGFFALCVQAVCDFDYTFTFVSAQCPGSTHDSVAFAVSGLARLLSGCADESMARGYWIAADDAYCCRDRLLTPWPGRGLSPDKDCFNYWQSSARIYIEQAFGMLVWRWGIFWRPIRAALPKASRLVVVCMKLHNFIVSNGSIAVPDAYEEDSIQHHDAPDYSVHAQDELDTDGARHRRRRDLETSELREEWTHKINDMGLRRPARP
jgi:hypothetical protein